MINNFRKSIIFNMSNHSFLDSFIYKEVDNCFYIKIQDENSLLKLDNILYDIEKSFIYIVDLIGITDGFFMLKSIFNPIYVSDLSFFRNNINDIIYRVNLQKNKIVYSENVVKFEKKEQEIKIVSEKEISNIIWIKKLKLTYAPYNYSYDIFLKCFSDNFAEGKINENAIFPENIQLLDLSFYEMINGFVYERGKNSVRIYFENNIWSNMRDCSDPRIKKFLAI